MPSLHRWNHSRYIYVSHVVQQRSKKRERTDRADMADVSASCPSPYICMSATKFTEVGIGESMDANMHFRLMVFELCERSLVANSTRSNFGTSFFNRLLQLTFWEYRRNEALGISIIRSREDRSGGLRESKISYRLSEDQSLYIYEYSSWMDDHESERDIYHS